MINKNAAKKKWLEDRGMLLHGPIVPDDFHSSDGCSLPVPRSLQPFFEAWWRWACVVHDYEYHLARLKHRDLITSTALTGTKALQIIKEEWWMYRYVADRNLRKNIVKMTPGKWYSRKRILARNAARIYFLGVRLGGRRAAKWKGELAGDGRG